MPDLQKGEGRVSAVDPVCAFHGLRWSEHEHGRCIYCPLCFRSDEYEHWVDETGQKWDLCRECGEAEALAESL